MPVARLRPISSHIAAVDLHGRFQVAAFFVRHEEGLILVDSGFPGWAYAILTAARSLPEPNRITDLILTHVHADHMGGAAEIVRQTGARVWCSTAERRYFEGRRLARDARGWLARLTLGLHELTVARQAERVVVDETLEEGDRLGPLRVVGLPGHTPGQIGLVHEADGVCLCGDAFFNADGRIGLDPVPGLTADRARARLSLQRLLDLGVDDIVPSHGGALLGDARARLQEFLGTGEG